jgi:Protein of unknown function (DUF3828)
MPSRRELFLGAAFLSVTLATVASPLAAADPSAHDFVAAIYDTYVSEERNGVALDSDAKVRRYFEPSLAALILKDRKQAARRGEVGVLDFDPFVDAQDWEISDLAIAVEDAGPAKARASVKFKNVDKPSVVALELIRIGNAWKISNVTWQPHEQPNNLRALFAK